MNPTPLWPADYALPPTHCADVLAGSYDVPFNPSTPPIILDLGANVGAFCRWAVTRWPGCTIHAYEPQPANYALLLRTIRKLNEEHDAEINPYNFAIGEHPGSYPLYDNGVNCGEWSLFDQGEGKPAINVAVVSAGTLPQADILKIDVEGAEAAVLGGLAHRIKEFSAIMMEVHAASLLGTIKDFLAAAGFQLTGEKKHFEHRIELRFVRRDLLPSTPA